MYGKLFDSMYDSTLAEDWRALITFQQMIVLCDADGMIDMTPQALSRRTGIPIEYIKAGIEILEKPDPYSRTPDQNGVRIELIDDHRPWGWHIVNHEKYKTLQDADTIRAQTRERVRKHREMKRTVTDGNDQKRHTDTDINKDKPKPHPDKAKVSKIPYEAIINLYHELLPHNPRVKILSDARKRTIKARWNNGMGELEDWTRLFGEYVAKSKFLTGQSPPSHGRSKSFIADIDFLINETNIVKIVEGKYHE